MGSGLPGVRAFCDPFETSLLSRSGGMSTVLLLVLISQFGHQQILFRAAFDHAGFDASGVAG